MIKNLKKVISSIAAVAILASSASAFALTFPDVDASASYANAVNTLTALGVINGDENGKFNPDNTVTRAEFTKMVVEALGEGDSATALTSSQFTDAAGHWAVGYIAQGVSKGFINGYDEVTFGPDDTVTFAQAVKMLVCAIGYDTYATQQGGWPSGYMAYGSSLKIINGVSGVNNDTALTRAQCAVLINNAMKAPLCVIDGYKYEVGLAGTVAVPNLVQKDEKDEDYQTLLTDKHDAYVAKGRVMGTSKGNGALEAGEVTFRVEVADNFDDLTYGKNDASADEFTMWAGDTDAENLLFTYAEAVAQYDEDADEWTILAITPYGNSKTVDFIADDVSDEDGYDNFEHTDKIAVFKSASSNSTTKYDLADDVAVYVNGVEMVDMGADDAEAGDLNAVLTKYLFQNPTGQVTLVDATEEGSTSTDGEYDFVMITCYRTAVVSSVAASSSSVKVYFDLYDSELDTKWEWDPEDEDINITFTLDGEEIAYTDLLEDDVISIAYNEDLGFDSSEDFEVLVSRNKVTGNVTSIDTDEDENTARIDGQDYKADKRLLTVDQIELNTEYVLFLDAFGLAVNFDEGETAKNYGVIVGMYTSAGNDHATVRMITGAGEVVAYECKDATEEGKFFNIIKAAGDGESYSGETITKTEIEASVGVENAVVTYTLSSGKIRLKDTVDKKGDVDLEFKASTSKLGSYAINDAVTKIIDMDGYLNGGDSTVGTMTVASFEDEAIYEAYVFDKNKNGDYRFIIVKAGTSSLRAEASLATIMLNPGQADIDGTECYETIVARDGAEDVALFIEKTDATAELNLGEGDVVVYTIGTDGYVEADKIEKVFDCDENYDTLLGATVADANFTKMISATAVDYDTNKVKYGTDAATTEKKIELYFGAIYEKRGSNITLIKGYDENKESNLDDETYVEEFSLDNNTVSYVYDYANSKKNRVSLGQVPGSTDAIWNAVTSGAEDNIITWASDDASVQTVASEDVQPNLALIKVVDDDVTEVIVFLAD